MVSVFSIVLEIPKLYVGEFATSLGWLDTPMPAITWGLMALTFGAIVSLGVSGRSPFRSLSLLAAATAMVVIPVYLQLSVDEPVGVWVQPRYLLPLVLTLGVILALKPAEARPITVTQVALVSLLVITAHTWALHRTIRRSVTGVDVEDFDLSGAAEWWWNTSIGPNLVWATGSAAFAVLLIVLGVMVLRSQSAADAGGVPEEALASASPPSGAQRETPLR